jgi:hypothetical protein
LAPSALALLLASGLPVRARAEAAPDAPVVTAPAAKTTPPKGEGPDAAAEVSEIVVNGVPYKETVLPTRLSTSSVYGLDLSVMDTPRNTTLLSTTQLQTLNVQDPRAFSYLTASSYSDSSFGTPNIPRIRGQYADVFYNGMRQSFTENGYGAPPNFDVMDNVSITKGPASVIDGPGPDVGGEVDFLTKRPSLSHFAETASFSIDSVQNRRWTVDVQGPIIPGELGLRISYSGAHSDSYFYNHFDDKQAVYVALRWAPNDKYQLDFNGEVNSQQYTEDVGVNRVNQNLIDHNLYLTGGPDGNQYDTSSSLPVATPTSPNPFSPAAPFLTEINLSSTGVPLNPRVTIDQTPGVWSDALTYNAQLIQTYRLTSDITLEDNAFFAYQDSENREPYYYSDSSNGTWSFENRGDIKFNNTVSLLGASIKSEFITGVTFRFAHVNYISDFSYEIPSVFDLTTNPDLWVTVHGLGNSPYAAYSALADEYSYMTAFGHQQYGVPGRDPVSGGNSGISDLYDTGFFFQHRMEFSPELSVLYGGRIDAVQARSHDHLGPAVFTYCGADYDLICPQTHTTGVYGLGEVNTSVVYRPTSWVSTYITFDWTQSTNPDGGEGGINAYLQVPDHVLMRADSYLYEAGFKFNLLNNKLFAGTAVFDQKKNVPVGNGGTSFSHANIRGVEIELNYQPTRNLWATASYSYIDTTLDSPAPFYNYPAEPGLNVDGAGAYAVFAPGQKFQDPGVPQQLFNFLGNYKFNDGIGLRFGLQVTGPIETTTSGYLSSYAFAPAGAVSANGYYQSPIIPWQYTMNTAIFYEWSHYSATFSVYNLTNRLNWQAAPPYYGNDFLVRNDPRTYELRLVAKF